jgi:uncharacterized membrane protein YedE/YeeE
MEDRKEPRPYLNSYVAGTILGIVLFATFYVTGGGLGSSAGLTHVQTGVLKWFAAAHIDRVAYFAEVGGGTRSPWSHYAVYMLIGNVGGGFISGLFNRRLTLELRKGPNISNAARVATALLGGALMGYGARLARGCTSGQALSGGAVLSVGSWAFMFAVFGGAYAMAWFVRRLWN